MSGERAGESLQLGAHRGRGPRALAGRASDPGAAERAGETNLEMGKAQSDAGDFARGAAALVLQRALALAVGLAGVVLVRDLRAAGALAHRGVVRSGRR